MPDTITITLPLPNKMLSPNHTVGSIGGRMAKAQAIKSYRQNAWLATLASIAERSEFHQIQAAQVTLVFYLPDKRRRDIGNLEASMKPAYDGLVDAGLIVDDDYLHLEHAQSTIEIDKGNPRVEITVTRVTHWWRLP